MPKVNSKTIDYDDIDDVEMDKPAFVEGEFTKDEGTYTIPPTKEEKEVVEEIKEDKLETPTEPYKAFKTEAEFNAVLEAERNKTLVEALQKPTEPIKEEPTEPVKFFSEDWTPKDWNDYTSALLTNPEVRKTLIKGLAPDIKTTLDDMTQAERAELDKVNSEFDKEYDALAVAGKVPERTSDEGKKVDAAISKIGAEYGIGSITKAYELWSKIPEDQGGGYKIATVAKKGFQERKAKSGLIGGGTATPSVNNKPIYKDIHNKSMDDLIQESEDD